VARPGIFLSFLTLAGRLTLPLLPILPMLLAVPGCGDGGEWPAGEAVEFDACAPVALVLDASLTTAQAAGVGAAIALWNDRAGTRLALTADQGGLVLPLHFQTAAPPFHGFYDAPNGQVFINNDLSGAPLAITIAHEIGHAFGLAHVSSDQRTSVMNPNNLVVEPTTEDIDTLAMRWGACLASARP
jgi:hypothetical protein